MFQIDFSWFGGPRLAVAAVLLGATALALASDRDAAPPKAAKGQAADAKERRREGTKYEGVGRFEITSDRVSFYPGEGQQSFRVLENLALERVSRVLSESREPRQWNVTGVFTEFQGGNYLLMSRAAVRLPTNKESSRPAAIPVLPERNSPPGD